MVTLKKLFLLLILSSIYNVDLFCVGQSGSLLQTKFTEKSKKLIRDIKKSGRPEWFKNFGSMLYERIQRYKQYLAQKYRTLKEKTGEFAERISKKRPKEEVQLEKIETKVPEISPPIEIPEESKALVKTTPQEIVSYEYQEKQRIVKKTTEIVQDLLKKYPFPLVIKTSDMKRVFIPEITSYNKGIASFIQKMEQGTYINLSSDILNKNLFALNDFSNWLNELKKNGYILEQEEKALEIPKILFLEAPPKLEIKKAEAKEILEPIEKERKPEFVQEVKVLTPEEEEYQLAFANFPPASEYKPRSVEEKKELITKQYEHYDQSMQQLKEIIEQIRLILDYKKYLNLGDKKYDFSNIAKEANKIFFNIIDRIKIINSMINDLLSGELKKEDRYDFEDWFKSLLEDITNTCSDVVKKFNEFNETLSYSARASLGITEEKMKEQKINIFKEVKRALDLIFMSFLENLILPFLKLISEKNQVFITNKLSTYLLSLKKNIVNHKSYLSIDSFPDGLHPDELSHYETLKETAETILNHLQQINKKPGLLSRTKQYLFGTPEEQRLKAEIKQIFEKIKQRIYGLKHIYFVIPPEIDVNYLDKKYKERIEAIQSLIKDYEDRHQNILKEIRNISLTKEESKRKLADIEKDLIPLEKDYKRLTESLKKAPLLELLSDDKYSITFIIKRNLREKLEEQIARNKEEILQ